MEVSGVRSSWASSEVSRCSDMIADGKIALVQAKDYRDPTSGKALHEMSLEENQALLSAIRQRMREEADDAEIVKQGADDGDVFG